jgi:hypothetical protein
MKDLTPIPFCLCLTVNPLPHRIIEAPPGRHNPTDCLYCDIASDIVNLKNLRKIKLELQQIRRSPQGRAAVDLEAIARQLGRYRDRRGKEPTYVRFDDPALTPPLSIPGHVGDLKVGTVRSIVDVLLNDVDEWEIFLLEVEDDNGTNDDTH